jgi:hypothetical protein
MLLCRTWLLPCKTVKTGAGIILPYHFAHPHCKNFLCPASARPRIVLPVFARSCSADTFGMTKAFFYYQFKLIPTQSNLSPNKNGCFMMEAAVFGYLKLNFYY